VFGSGWVRFHGWGRPGEISVYRYGGMLERDRVQGRKMVVERDDSTCFALLFQNERKFEFGEGREREALVLSLD